MDPFPLARLMGSTIRCGDHGHVDGKSRRHSEIRPAHARLGAANELFPNAFTIVADRLLDDACRCSGCVANSFALSYRSESFGEQLDPVSRMQRMSTGISTPNRSLFD